MKRLALIILTSLIWMMVPEVKAGGKLMIYPSMTQIDLLVTDKSKTVEITANNQSNLNLSYKVSVVDFGSLDEAGGVAFLGLDRQVVERKYGLASWMSLEKDSLNLAPGKSDKLKVTIGNRESLGPGGHYGAILLTLDSENKAQNSVGVNQVFSSLIFVKKIGGEKEELKLNKVDIQKNYWGSPNKVTLRFQNSGNVHVVPRGVVEVKNMWGKMIFKGIVNGDSTLIMPETFRNYEIKMNPLSWWLFPGKNVMTINYRIEGFGGQMTWTTNYFVLGNWILWVAILIILVTGILVIKQRKNRS